jgi:S1-C subfamily serine protease
LATGDWKLKKIKLFLTRFSLTRFISCSTLIFVDMRRLIVLLVILLGIAAVWQVGTRYFPQLEKSLTNSSPAFIPSAKTKVVQEENLVIDVVKKAGPSVITIGVKSSGQSLRQTNPNDPFSLFFGQQQETPPPNANGTPDVDYIGSGFVVDKNGLIVTNKHVVSDASMQYVVVNDKGKEYDVQNIYRDPINDIAILKIGSSDFQPLDLGDSGNLQVGQFVIAIGTALGEFRNTVTTGVISGLGRGITAGSPFEGEAEQLDNVIQTDAAINPGNSGGPLINSSGQVIGINTAVSSQGQNIGFAIPINAIKESLRNFNATGQFNRAFLGVSYSMITQRAALLNDVPQGALVQQVIPGSGADDAGVKEGDIITKVDGKAVTEDSGGLAKAIANKKVGDKISITYYRDGDSQDTSVTLGNATSQ